MKPEPETRFLRYELDDKIKRWRRAPPSMPESGWINTIREALDMSERQLGQRLKITQSAISDLQRSEKAGTITLAALKRAATAMQCTLIYALIPNHGSLEHTIRKRRRTVSTAKLLHILPPNKMRETLTAGFLDAFGKNIKRRLLWEDSPLPPVFRKIEKTLKRERQPTPPR